MRIEYEPLSLIQTWPKNPKNHDTPEIIASFKRFGFVAPLVKDETTGALVAGHGRLDAAVKMKAAGEKPPARVEVVDGEWRIPVVRGIAFDSPLEAQAYLLADNQLSERGGWNTADLIAMLQNIQPSGFRGTGFDDKALKQLIAKHAGLTPIPGEDEAITKAKARTKRGQLWQLGAHRILCGNSTNAADVAKLMGGGVAQIMVTDPPYGVNYDPQWRQRAGLSKGTRKMAKVANDDRADWTEAWKLFSGAVAYVWHGGLHAAEVQHSLETAGFDIRAQIIWAKDRFALSRGHYHWQHEPCQPPGTMVRTPKGLVPIEKLSDGDGVLSYDSYSSTITAKRKGRPIRTAVRDYDGELFEVECAGRRTSTTDGHQFSVRFTDVAPDLWTTYLMRRGGWWRVGILRVFNSRGFGPSVRREQENADDVWILGVFPNKIEAACAEQILAIKYGIPMTHWETDRAIAGSCFRSKDQIASIYEALDLAEMERRAGQCLRDHGRRLEYPMVTREDAAILRSRRVTTRVRACNLIPQIMGLPIPKENGDEFTWEPIVNVRRTGYSGPVYSLDVAVDHHYIADGIVTHNCWYAVRKGKEARWNGSRNQDTLWREPGTGNLTDQIRQAILAEDLKKLATLAAELESALQTTVWAIPAREDAGHGHGTQKPVECMRRPIVNHTAPGEGVYDPFIGSGSTLIGCESTGRLCYGMEIEPRCCDIVIERYETLTGNKAKLVK